MCLHVIICVYIQPPQLSKKEIEELLKKGAYGALMEGDDDDANRYMCIMEGDKTIHPNPPFALYINWND